MGMVVKVFSSGSWILFADVIEMIFYSVIQLPSCLANILFITFGASVMTQKSSAIKITKTTILLLLLKSIKTVAKERTNPSNDLPKNR